MLRVSWGPVVGGPLEGSIGCPFKGPFRWSIRGSVLASVGDLLGSVDDLNDT